MGNRVVMKARGSVKIAAWRSACAAAVTVVLLAGCANPGRPVPAAAGASATSSAAPTSRPDVAGPIVVSGGEPSAPAPEPGAPSSAAESTTETSAPEPTAQTSALESPAPESPGEPTASTPATTTPAPTTTTPAPRPATVTLTPNPDEGALSPLSPLTVNVRGGTIGALQVVAADGTAIAGTLSADRTRWTSTHQLRYGGTYAATGTALGEAGSKPTPIGGTWRVIDPEQVTMRISPGNGAEVGVAAPVIVRFGYYAKDRAEIEKRMKITTVPKVEGAWAWIRHDGESYPSLNWRPKKFWPAGTRVRVEANLFGVPFADGLYGLAKPVVSEFTIGRNLVTYADARTKMITVKRDGKTIAEYPTSMGRGDDVGDPKIVTRSGIHIVMSKFEKVKMSNPEYGYRNLTEYWAVRISNNGEYIHQNMETYWAQGKKNLSHGCLNLSDVNAKAYFDLVRYGDPVVITGTSVKLGPADGDYYGWALDWDTWLSMSAVR